MLLQMNLDSVGIIYAAWDESFIIFLILSSVGSWCLCAHYDDSAVVRGHLERAVFFSSTLWVLGIETQVIRTGRECLYSASQFAGLC